MAEKRVKKRHRKRYAVSFGLDAAEKKRGFTDDLNHGGLFIRSAVVVPPGVKIRVEIDHPDGQIVLTGQVRWAKSVPANFIHKMKGGMGLEITAFLVGEDIYRTLCEELDTRWGGVNRDPSQEGRNSPDK